MAAQLTLTNGPAANGLFRCMCAASSSLPVPDSPVSSTRASELRHPRRLFDDSPEGGARADHPGRVADQFAQPRVLLRERGLLQRVLEDEQEPVAAERLLEEVERARAGGRHRVGDGRVPGDHDDRRVRALVRDERQQVDAARVREAHVQEIRVRVRPGQPPLEVGAAAADGDGIARALQHQPERGADVLLVVDNHDASSRSRLSSFCGRKDQPERGPAQLALDERQVAAGKQRVLP